MLDKQSKVKGMNQTSFLKYRLLRTMAEKHKFVNKVDEEYKGGSLIITKYRKEKGKKIANFKQIREAVKKRPEVLVIQPVKELLNSSAKNTQRQSYPINKVREGECGSSNLKEKTEDEAQADVTECSANTGLELSPHTEYYSNHRIPWKTDGSYYRAEASSTQTDFWSDVFPIKQQPAISRNRRLLFAKSYLRRYLTDLDAKKPQPGTINRSPQKRKVLKTQTKSKKERKEFSSVIQFDSNKAIPQCKYASKTTHSHCKSFQLQGDTRKLSKSPQKLRVNENKQSEPIVNEIKPPLMGRNEPNIKNFRTTSYIAIQKDLLSESILGSLNKKKPGKSRKVYMNAKLFNINKTFYM